MKHYEVINNGMGAPSMYLMVLAAEKKIPCDLVIVADTGSENDCLLSNGERVTAQNYYDTVVEPLASEFGIESCFVRAKDKQGNDRKPMIEIMRDGIIPGVPTYGSGGGQLSQGCTDKWKVSAIRQELRRRGAESARSALGLTMDEVQRMRKSDTKWHVHYYPLIRPYPHYKATIRDKLSQMAIPYMLSSQCDMCPHQNYARWSRLSEETINDLADVEAGLGGTQFLTPKRIPLKMALSQMANEQQLDIFDICDSGYCFT